MVREAERPRRARSLRPLARAAVLALAAAAALYAMYRSVDVFVQQAGTTPSARGESADAK